jgi:hypothetical protein
MNCLILTTRRVVLVPRSLEEGPEVVESDASVDLRERTLDDVLQVRRTERAAAIQLEKMSPRLGGKAPSLVRTQHSEVHEKERLGVKARET